MNPREAAQSIKAGKEKRYSIVGAEPFFKNFLIQLFRQYHPDYSYHCFYPDQIKEALGLISSMALFQPRLVVLKNFDKMDTKKFEGAIEGNEDLLVFVLYEKANLRSNATTKLISKTIKVDCDKLKEHGNDYPYWVLSRATDHGFTLDNGVDDFIYSRIGPNLYNLDNELNKLLLYKNSDKRITLDDAKTVIGKAPSANCYEIFEHLIKKNIKGALQAFHSYAGSQDNFIGFVGFLLSYTEKLYRMLLLKETGASPDGISDIIGLPRYIVKTKYLPRAIELGKRRIEKIFDNVCDLDVQVRLFKGNKKIIIEKFIIGFNNI